jgi:hypothetical protein
MELKQAIQGIEGFSNWPFADKIKFFGWFLHIHRNQPYFSSSDIGKCFDELSASPPSAIPPFLSSMVNRSVPVLLKKPQGYCLESRTREHFDGLYRQRDVTVQIHKLLAELPAKIPTVNERQYLEEALICFKHGAFRAAIVMCWNLAFDHLCRFVLDKHLTEFNTQLPKSYPRADISSVAKLDDFSELKESQVLQVCKSATIISGSLHKVLKEKLDRRNVAAHPSGIHVSQLTAEDVIKDLIENAVLKLS